MRVFTLLAALATLGAAKVVPSPKITSANAAPDHAQTSPEITPAPTHPPYSDRLEAYRELLKRSANATPAFKKRSEGPCPVDCGNGFCCPLDQKCFTEKDSNDQVSMLCGYPELRKRQATDFDSMLSSLYAITYSYDFDAYYSSLLSEIYAFTTDPYYSSLLASITRNGYGYGTRTTGSGSLATDSYNSGSSSSSSHKKKSPIGAIVGGVIGGLLFIALIAGIVFFLVRRNKKQVPPTSQAFVGQVQPGPTKPQAAPVPEKAFYQPVHPTVPGAVEADGVQTMPPQYTGNSQQYPQQPIQQQQYPQQQQQQQQNFQQPGAVYHEVHNTSSPPPQGHQNYPPPPPPPVSPPPQQQYSAPGSQPGTVYHEMGAPNR